MATDLALESYLANMAFKGEIDFPFLKHLLNRRDFVLCNPVPRFLIQAAMLGPLDNQTAENFVTLCSSDLELKESITREFEAQMLKAHAWKYMPIEEFNNGVEEYTKRRPEDVQSFQCFNDTIDRITNCLQKNLLPQLREQLTPVQVKHNYPCKPRKKIPVVIVSDEDSDDQEYKNMNPVKPSPGFLARYSQTATTTTSSAEGTIHQNTAANGRGPIIGREPSLKVNINREDYSKFLDFDSEENDFPPGMVWVENGDSTTNTIVQRGKGINNKSRSKRHKHANKKRKPEYPISYLDPDDSDYEEEYTNLRPVKPSAQFLYYHNTLASASTSIPNNQ